MSQTPSLKWYRTEVCDMFTATPRHRYLHAHCGSAQYYLTVRSLISEIHGPNLTTTSPSVNDGNSSLSCDCKLTKAMKQKKKQRKQHSSVLHILAEHWDKINCTPFPNSWLSDSQRKTRWRGIKICHLHTCPKIWMIAITQWRTQHVTDVISLSARSPSPSPPPPPPAQTPFILWLRLGVCCVTVEQICALNVSSDGCRNDWCRDAI